MFRFFKLCLIAEIIFFLCVGPSLLQADPSLAPASLASTPPAILAPTDLISFDYTEADLNTVLKSIAYSYNLNLVISKNISGKVSARLKNVTLDDALNALLTLNNYTFYRVQNLLYIISQDERELSNKSFQLNYLFAKDCKDFVNKVLSKKGDIQVNQSTNSLVVMDYPENLVKVEELIKVVDQPPLQVLIEAKIVDIKSSDVEKIGTAWNIPGDSDPAVASNNLSTGSVSKDTDGALMKLLPRFKSFSANFSIDALLQTSDARILASPSIATLSGLEARIIIGDRIPYKSSTNSISSGTGGTTTNSVVQFAEVGTTLRVTPLVSSDGWITMKVHPEVSSVVQMIADAGPQTTTREADATIRVRDNETIIIGGLMGKNTDHSNNGVPGLASVPGLGWLFKRQSSSDTQSELMVFITPHIIRTPVDAPVNLKINTSPEVRIDAQTLGEDTGMLLGYMHYAEILEKDAARKSSPDLYLSLELIKVYKSILNQFPSSGKSDLCLFKIAAIYAHSFGKCESAEEALMKLRTMFPDSPYLDEAEAEVNICWSIANSGKKAGLGDAP
jgi:type IV pilus secretin PilQ/predicted competence protein